MSDQNPRAPSVRDVMMRILYGTGLAWLTPFVGRTDASDLESLRASVLRDLEWAEALLCDGRTRNDSLDCLDRVASDLARLVGRTRRGGAPEPNPSLHPVLYPWHVASGWTDYGALRLALLAALPDGAWDSALAELTHMHPVVLQGSSEAWNELVEDLKIKLRAPAPTGDRSIPQALQALWREIDFGRNERRLRVAKRSTVSSVTWSLVLMATIVTAFMLPDRRDGEPSLRLIILFGLLGGSVSALRSVKGLSHIGERSPLENEAVKLRLRPVVGSMAALMLYVVERSGLFFKLVPHVDPNVSVRVQIAVGDVTWAYYAISFLAGFSERFFLGVLDAVQQKFETAPPQRELPPGAQKSDRSRRTGSDGGSDAAVRRPADSLPSTWGSGHGGVAARNRR